MSDCCLVKKVATVTVYENKNEVRSYGYMAGDRNTPVMEVDFVHMFGEDDLSDCMLRYVIVSDLGDLIVGDTPIEINKASIELPNSLFNAEKRCKVQLIIASCDGTRILNLQQFTELKIVNSLTEEEVSEPVYDILINKIFDIAQNLQDEIKPIFEETKRLASEVSADRAIVVTAYNGFKESVVVEKKNIADLSNAEISKIKAQGLVSVGEVKAEGDTKVAKLDTDYKNYKAELELLVNTNQLLEVGAIMGNNYKGVYDDKKEYLPGQVFYKVEREQLGFSIPNSPAPVLTCTSKVEPMKQFRRTGESETRLEISRNQDIGIVGLYLGQMESTKNSTINFVKFPIVTDIVRISIPADDTVFVPVSQDGLELSSTLLSVEKKVIIDRTVCVGIPTLYQY